MKSFVFFLTSFLTLATLANGCPDLWISLNGKCYKTSTSGMDWYAAQQFCASEGGYLIEINDEDEQAGMFNIISDELHYWIGLADFAAENTWVWQHSYQEATFFFWAPEEPNNNGDCVHMANNYGFGWNDLECDRDYYDSTNIHALCETEP